MRDLARNLLFQIASSLGRGDHESLSSIGNLRTIPWKDLIELSEYNRVLPLLMDGMAHFAPDVLQDSQFDGLREHYAKEARKIDGQLDRLVKLLSELSSAGLTAIPFKGPLLAHLAFGSPTRREFRDIDLILPADQYTPAIELLQSLGFKCFADAPWETTVVNGSLDTAIYLDLHNRFMPPHLPEPNQVDRFWSRLQPLNVGHYKFLTLSLIDNLLISCLYLIKSWHNREPTLDYGLAVAVLLERAPAGIEQDLFAHAHQHGVGPAVRIACAAARHLAAGGVNPKFDPIILRYNELARRLFTDLTVVRPTALRGPFNFYAPRTIAVRRNIAGSDGKWLMRETRSLKLKLFFVNHEDRQWLRLPEAFNSLYLFIRPLRLTQKHLKQLCSRDG